MHSLHELINGNSLTAAIIITMVLGVREPNIELTDPPLDERKRRRRQIWRG